MAVDETARGALLERVAALKSSVELLTPSATTASEASAAVLFVRQLKSFVVAVSQIHDEVPLGDDLLVRELIRVCTTRFR